MKRLVLAVSATAISLGAVPVMGSFVVSEARAQQVLDTYAVEFALGSAELSASARTTIANAAAAFMTGTPTQINLVGHTDTSGPAAYNQALSERRAAAVRQALLAEGVPASAILANAVGQNQLIVPTADGVVEQANRVVTITLVGPSAPPPAPVVEPMVEPEPRWAFGAGPWYGFDVESDGHMLGLNLTADYRVWNNISIGAEQAGFWAFENNRDDDGFGGRTVASLDYNIGGWQNDTGMFGRVGLNAGYIYGEATDDSFIWGPELGVNLFGFDTTVAWDIRDGDFDEGIVSAMIGYEINF